MESDLKNIWKTKVNEDIKSYSDTELDDMVVRSARKSMRKLYPGWWAKFIICALVVAYLLWQIITGAANLPVAIFNVVVILIVTGSVMLVWWSMRKMNDLDPNVPLKNWIKLRIDYIDRSIRLRRKYKIWINAGVVLFIVGMLIIDNYVLNGRIMPYSFVVALGASLLALFVIRVLWKNRYGVVRDYLQKLYDQMDE